MPKSISYSSNGVNWTNSAVFPNFVGLSVDYDGVGKWVVVGQDTSGTGDNIYYSNDGKNWTAVNGPFGIFGQGKCVKYANGIWIAVGIDDVNLGNNIYTSSDGINWTGINGPFGSLGGFGNSVSFGNVSGTPTWVAVGNEDTTGKNIYYSTNNGANWTAVTGPFGFSTFSTSIGNSVFYDGSSNWVAVGQDGDGNGYNGYYSTDGQIWGTIIGIYGTSGSGNKVTYANGQWVSVGYGDSGLADNIYYSENAIIWNAVNGPFTDGGYGNSVLYDGSSTWVAVGKGNGSGNNIYYSTDNGVNWTPVNGPFGNFGENSEGRSVAFNGSQWIASGNIPLNDNKSIYYSSNGINWSASAGEPFGVNNGGTLFFGGQSIVYGNGLWVIVGFGEETPVPPINRYIDLSVFTLPTCPSSIKVDNIIGKVLTTSIENFKEGLYYAFYVNGNKVGDNIQTQTFEYTFSLPGRKNIYITCSDKPTYNSAQKSLPKNIVSIIVL